MQIIGVVCGKGGVAKTYTSVSLAAEFGKFKGLKVLLVDSDASRNLTNRCLAEDADPKFTIADIYRTKSFDPKKAILHADEDQFPNVDVLPGSREMDHVDKLIGGRMGADSILKRALSTLTDYDLIIIDCPPTRGIAVTNAIVASDGILSPFLLDDNSIDGVLAVDRIISDLVEVGILTESPLRLGSFCTAFDKPRSLATKLGLAKAQQNISSFIDLRIPASSHVREAIGSCTTLQSHRKHPVSKAYAELSTLVATKLGI